MKELFSKTFSELTTAAPLEIRGLEGIHLTAAQLSSLFAVVNYRYENMLPTMTYIGVAPDVLEAALCGAGENDGGVLAHAIVGRLREMGMERSGRAAARR